MLVFEMDFLVGASGLVLSSGLWLYFILKKDRIEREPLLTFILVGLGGGIISVFFAGFSNGLFSAATGIRFGSQALSPGDAAVFSLFVGLNEEFFKCAAAMLLIRRLKEFDEPADGIIYAMAVSLGFGVLENAGYMMHGGLSVLIPRTLVAIPAHLGFGALWGVGLAVARFRFPGRSMPRVVLPYLAAAVLCHGLYDFWLFAHLPASGMVTPLMVFLLWSYASRKMKFLVAHSPFLPPGQCPECGLRNKVGDTVCAGCGAAIYPEKTF